MLKQQQWRTFVDTHTPRIYPVNMTRFSTLLLVVSLGVPAPFVSGMFHICEFSGHVHEDCSCGEVRENPEWVREPCCSVHVIAGAVGVPHSTLLDDAQRPTPTDMVRTHRSQDWKRSLQQNTNRIRPPPPDPAPLHGSAMRVRICSWQA